jgi:hypothetical protein
MKHFALLKKEKKLSLQINSQSLLIAMVRQFSM